MDLDSGEVRPVSDVNVWELAWCGPDRLLAVMSEGAGEGAWYGAEVGVIDLELGTATAVHRAASQLAQPKAPPSGRCWSVLSGVASDRGLLAGEVLVGRIGQAPRSIDATGVHVTDHSWLGEGRVLFVGLRGLETVVGSCDVDSGQTELLWETSESCGVHQPEVSGVEGSDPVVVVESHRRPPTLARLRDGEVVPVLSTEGPGTDAARARTGTTRPYLWTSRDGTEVQGLLTTPDSPGRPGLVVNIHGGPIAAWQDRRIGRDVHTQLHSSRPTTAGVCAMLETCAVRNRT